MLGPKQEAILKVLSEADKPLTMAEIARRVGQERPNTAASLERLKGGEDSKGPCYIEFARSSSGRGKPYRLTKLGEAYVREMNGDGPKPPGSTAEAKLSNESIDPSRLCGTTAVEEAVKAASEMDVGQQFITRLAEELETTSDADAVLEKCRSLCEKDQRDVLVDALGEVLAELKTETVFGAKVDGRTPPGADRRRWTS